MAATCIHRPTNMYDHCDDEGIVKTHFFFKSCIILKIIKMHLQQYVSYTVYNIQMIPYYNIYYQVCTRVDDKVCVIKQNYLYSILVVYDL